jgi:hypothetical protein
VDILGQIPEHIEQREIGSVQFKRTMRSIPRDKGSSKAGPVPAQRRQLELEFRSLASLAVWLDQEEELVQLVPERLSSELPILIKS